LIVHGHGCALPDNVLMRCRLWSSVTMNCWGGIEAFVGNAVGSRVALVP
jgi:hypothetical protein